MRPVTASVAALVVLALVLSACGGGTHTETFALHRPCPLTDLRFAPSPHSATYTRMVPGEPVGALVCRYWGRGDSGYHPYTLAEQRYVPAARKLSQLAAGLDALKPNGTIASCGTAGGRSVLVMFRFRDEPDDPVRILRSGCTVASNGHLERIATGLEVGEHWPDEGLL